MTDARVQKDLLLPVDESPPPERLRWPMLLAAGTAVVLIHLALVTVFTPLAPEPVGDASSRADRATMFLSASTADADPLFLKLVDVYDPVSFLHPPEEVGFSFFRMTQDDFSLETPSEPVLPPQKFTELEPLPPFEPDPVVRPLVRDVADADEALDAEAAAAPTVSYPYCVVDSRPDVILPAIQLDSQERRILLRSPPSRPSLFELRHVAEIVLSAGDLGGSDPGCEAILTESCGDVELDLAARAWLDTLLNSQDARMQTWSLRRGDRFRVVWSAKALGKEPSR